jgi:general secretion pathway protein D
VDYPNVAREASSEMSASGTIGRSGGRGGSGNASSSSLSNASENRFWSTLTQNIRDLLRETDKLLPGAAESAPAPTASARSGGQAPAPAAAAPSAAPTGAAASPAEGQNVRFREAASVIANPETGVISVRASYRQHLRVREFLDRVLNGARRQVLIEATIVEVNLTDQYQQGINWTVFRDNLPLFRFGPEGGNMPSGVPVNGIIPSMAGFSRTFRDGRQTEITGVVRLLESFGNTKVLSSPKISALNNQAALLKVTEDIVYFTVSSNYQPGTLGTVPTLSVTSTPNTVSVGLVMSVMPQISDDDQVTLILRPSLSRVQSFVEDPGVAIILNQARAGGFNIPDVSSRVPQIQTREMESIVKVRSGDTAVLGGLMREESVSNVDQTPGVGNVPGLGNLFKYKSRVGTKSELVIFLKPTVVTSASLSGDYQGFDRSLGNAMSPSNEHPSRPFTGPQNFGVTP